MPSLFELLKAKESPQQNSLAPLPTGNLGAGSSPLPNPDEGVMVADMLSDLQNEKLARLRSSGMQNPTLFDVMQGGAEPTPKAPTMPLNAQRASNVENGMRDATGMKRRF